jgi:hypothetical protein
VQRVLAFPTKRFQRPLLGYLSREEMAASQGRGAGVRDPTGKRIAELTVTTDPLAKVFLNKSLGFRKILKIFSCLAHLSSSFSLFVSAGPRV